MWVKFKKTYAGPLGMFVIDTKMDLAEDVVRKLPKGIYKPCCAPWEEHLDKAAIKKAELVAEAKQAADDAARLDAEARDLHEKAEMLLPVAETMEKKYEAAKKAADDAIVKAEKSPTDKNKKSTAGLAREARRKYHEYQKAAGEFSAAISASNLKSMEAEDAKQKADNLAAKLNPAKKADAGGDTGGEPAAEGSQPVAGGQTDAARKTRQ